MTTRTVRNLAGAAAASLAILGMGAASSEAIAQKRSIVAIGITSNLTTFNPYGDSAAHTYSIWCKVYGCLGLYNFEKADYVGMMATKWETPDPTTWIFHFRRDVKRHDGRDFHAEDVVHSYNRVLTDSESAQKSNITPIKTMEVVDQYTVKITTKEPTAPLLEYLFDRLAITSKDLFDKHGAKDADRRHALGYGPYKFKEMKLGESVVLEKNEAWPGIKKENPDVFVMRRMPEPEQRVTSLLNGEIQIARYIPPHLLPRVAANRNVRVEKSSSVEIMFVAMNPNFKPWDNVKLRQAVAHAIDRETLAKTVMQGEVEVLYGPLGPGQYSYDPGLEPKLRFDLEKAKRLVVEAGFPNGVDVEMSTPVGRYVNDKQAMEAVVPMLAAAGIRLKLQTPEYSTHWTNVQRGRIGFYYQGRGSVVDPSPAIAQYFETGVTPRIGWSNAKFDELMRKERQTFDPAERKRTLNAAFSILLQEVPAHFLWRPLVSDGVSNTIVYKPEPNDRIWALDIAVKQ